MVAFLAEIPDVLLSDIGMPGEDGYSLIRRVRALPVDQGAHIPAAALTAYTRAEDRQQVLGGICRASVQAYRAGPGFWLWWRIWASCHSTIADMLLRLTAA